MGRQSAKPRAPTAAENYCIHHRWYSGCFSLSYTRNPCELLAAFLFSFEDSLKLFRLYKAFFNHDDKIMLKKRLKKSFCNRERYNKTSILSIELV